MVSGLKSALRRTLIPIEASLAPLTWRFHRRGSLLVLMYHRVLPRHSPDCRLEQPGMYVTPETLDLHLTELKRHFRIVHLDDWLQRAITDQPVPRLACAITFDDGWRDNLSSALSVLTKHAAPATVFLVSDFVRGQHWYWPHALANLAYQAFRDRLSIRFPVALTPLMNRAFAAAEVHGEFCAEDADALVSAAKAFGEHEIRELIASTDGFDRVQAAVRPFLDAEEVNLLAASGLVRFGSHTATHFRLGGAPMPATLEHEIIGSKVDLQEICGQEIKLFCYPNGETSESATALVRNHYLGAVTTRKGWFRSSLDRHLIPRRGLHEDATNSAASLLARISGLP